MSFALLHTAYGWDFCKHRNSSNMQSQRRCFPDRQDGQDAEHKEIHCTAKPKRFVQPAVAGGINFLWENLYPQHPPGPYPYYEDPRYFPGGVWGCIEVASSWRLSHRCSCSLLLRTRREGPFPILEPPSNDLR